MATHLIKAFKHKPAKALVSCVERIAYFTGETMDGGKTSAVKKTRFRF